MIIIDVRTAEEYAVMHHPEAINIPLDDLKNGAYPPTGKDQEIGVYCRTGSRASEAEMFLIAKGFTNVTNIGPLESTMKL